LAKSDGFAADEVRRPSMVSRRRRENIGFHQPAGDVSSARASIKAASRAASGFAGALAASLSSGCRCSLPASRLIVSFPSGRDGTVVSDAAQADIECASKIKDHLRVIIHRNLRAWPAPRPEGWGTSNDWSKPKDLSASRH